MIHQIAHPNVQSTHLNWLYKISAAVALMATGLLTLSAVSGIQSVIANRWPGVLEDNWLVVIFKLQAGFHSVQYSVLNQINILDLLILAFVAIIYGGLYAALRNTSRLWSLIALAQPILGIALFLFTKTAGRSALMGGELVISAVMLRSGSFSKRTACIGMLSAMLLLAGDLGASLAPSTILAIAMSVGYMLLVIWLFLIGRRLLQLGHKSEME